VIDRLDALRKRLDDMIKNGANSEEILEVSIELDSLINSVMENQKITNNC
jgi:hypothetical protein